MLGSEPPTYSLQLVRLRNMCSTRLSNRLAAATPPWGKLSDIFGRKPILLAAIAVFFIGSLIGALANNMNALIAGRVIQGTGGGGILGLCVTVVGDVFSPRWVLHYHSSNIVVGFADRPPGIALSTMVY